MDTNETSKCSVFLSTLVQGTFSQGAWQSTTLSLISTGNHENKQATGPPRQKKSLLFQYGQKLRMENDFYDTIMRNILPLATSLF